MFHTKNQNLGRISFPKQYSGPDIGDDKYPPARGAVRTNQAPTLPTSAPDGVFSVFFF